MFRKIIFNIVCLSPLVVAAQNKSIGQRTFNYKDDTRKRPLITEVWYPTDEDSSKAFNPPGYPFVHTPTIRNAQLPIGKYPLVMLSHGTGGGRITLEWLADALVKQGFIVAAVDHWGNTYYNKLAIDFLTPWERPQDISIVLTQLLQDKDFGSVIDQNKIGAAGFSIGGYTTLALVGAKISTEALGSYSKTTAWIKEIKLPEFPNLIDSVNMAEIQASYKRSPDLQDKRIKAFFAICPAVGEGFEKESQVKALVSPVYIVAAQSDSIAPTKTNAAVYHRLIKGSKYLVIPGKAGHYTFLNEGTEEAKKTMGIFMNDDATVSRHAVHKQVGEEAVKFFKESL